MSDKYCPAGKIECENFLKIKSGTEASFGYLGFCDFSKDHHSLAVTKHNEVCMVPSKKVKVVDKYEKAWEAIYDQPLASTRASVNKSEFIQALKEAGL